MFTQALLARFRATPGREGELEEFVRSLAEVAGRSSPAWFAARLGPGHFALFDAFADEAARDAHLHGPVAEAWKGREALLAGPPEIRRAQVLEGKPPDGSASRALLLTFRPRPGKEADVERLLQKAREKVDREPGTAAWFALRFEDGEYGHFGTFTDAGARFAHLTGKVPRKLAKYATEVLDGVPHVDMADLI